MSKQDSFEHVLSGRYPSGEMKSIFSEREKIRGWRRMWIEIARASCELGLPISKEQIKEMEENIDNIDFDFAAAMEKALRHDVMANVKSFGQVCPSAAGIIHLGCTSCEITDNAELVVMKKALKLIEKRIATVVHRFSLFAEQYKDLPTLGFSHFQSAQPVTVGKRACMWTDDLLSDLKAVKRQIAEMRFRGVKGTTGTQASFLALFDGDHHKVRMLDRKVANAFDFKNIFPITGQTYSRKQDSDIIFMLSSLGATAHRIANDLRLLAHDKEIEEPFEKDQVGSSAMPYKRNPMRSERVTALARILIAQVIAALQTHAEQWLERTLDDSAARRVFISESFLLADSILLILQNVAEGLIVYPEIIRRNLAAELPFMASEEIIAKLVKDHGADRQEAHERIRLFSIAAARNVKELGLHNNLIELIIADDYFQPIVGALDGILDPKQFIGRAPQQVDEYPEEEVRPMLSEYEDILTGKVELNI